MAILYVGIDLAKNVFAIHGVDEHGKPAHSALGPGVPGPPREAARVSKFESRHQLAWGAIVLAKSVLGGYITSIGLQWRQRGRSRSRAPI